MKTPFFFIVCLLITFSGFAQEPVEINYESFDAFLKVQNDGLNDVDNGLNEKDVENIMGGPIIVKIPKIGKKRKLNQLFKQPEFSNSINRGPKKQIKILWYFSTPKNEDGIISKRECTPVVFQNDSVIGKGWPFFNTFRKSL